MKQMSHISELNSKLEQRNVCVRVSEGVMDDIIMFSAQSWWFAGK